MHIFLYIKLFTHELLLKRDSYYELYIKHYAENESKRS